MRRRGPLTALLLIALAVIAVGWALSAPPTASGGATYVEAVLGRPLRVNPLAAPANDAEDDLVALVFAGLMRIRGDGSPEPDLAASWEVTADGLTYTFHLRDGLTWHDGLPLTAQDVAYTIGRIQAPDFAGAPSLAVEWQGVQTFVADPLTVLFRLPEPAADFLVRASVGLLPAAHADQIDAGAGLEVAPFDRAPVGAGPYRLVRLDDEQAVLERNTSYYGGTPNIARIELRFADSLGEEARLLRNGEVDGALFGEQATDVEAAALASRGDEVTTVLMPRAAYTILYFNNQRGPLANSDLRRAVAATIDRARVLAAAGQIRAAVGDGPIVPGSWAYTPSPRQQLPAEALWAASGWILDQAGHRTRLGAPLTLSLVTNTDAVREAMAAEVARQLEAAGVSVEVTVEPAARVVSDYLRTADYDLALFGWEAAPDPDPYSGWHTSQIGGLGANVAGFQDPEADALLEAARTTMDQYERRDLYALFIARFTERAASLVLAYPSRLYAIPAHLEGVDPGLLFSSASRFRDVATWRLR